MLLHNSRINSGALEMQERPPGAPERNPSLASNTAGRASPLKFFSSGDNKQSRQPSQSSEPREKSHKRWTVDYLTDLRRDSSVRPTGARPMGARPAPLRNAVSAMETSRVTSTIGGRLELQPRRSFIEEVKRSISPTRSNSAVDHRQTAGRPLVPQPDVGVVQDIVKANADRDGLVDIEGQKSPLPYYERGTRWMERQEAKSLRVALEQTDLEEEKRVHAAAQDEAVDLVWKHKYSEPSGKSPTKPYANPDVPKVQLREHLRAGSHARSQSFGPYESLYVTKGGMKEGKRTASDGSTSTNKSDKSNKSKESAKSRVSSASTTKSDKSTVSKDSQGEKRRTSLSFIAPAAKLFGNRRLSWRKSRNSSGENADNQRGVFSNPGDKIYEEPEAIEEATQRNSGKTEDTRPLKPRSRNTSGTYKPSWNKAALLDSMASSGTVVKHSVEIQKNPPSQSRDPDYCHNKTPPPVSEESVIEASEKPAMKDGLEIRSDDIRAATSMKLKDRKESLPKPTFVSDSPGRPIVSFQKDFKSREAKLKEQSLQRPGSRGSLAGARPLPGKPAPLLTTASAPIVPGLKSQRKETHANERSIPQKDTPRNTEKSPVHSSHQIPKIDASNVPCIQINHAPDIPSIDLPDEVPPIPSINFPDELPSIQVFESPVVPSISVSPGTTVIPGTAPIPTINAPGNPNLRPGGRPLPHHTRTAPASNTPSDSHWSLAGTRSTAQASCSSCALPISGRTLSAGGTRFHPACFACHQCGTQLEHVAFYPEPDGARAERLAHEAALALPLDAEPRFFCHLDFHETFSPRCKSCTTPIEAEVILACGAHWHKGHFFCAQCGDPFDDATPFVEKDGWAWCLGCYKGRYSAKCAACRKPVVDGGVKAMGSEWHEGCFVCGECRSTFDDGRFFTRPDDAAIPICVTCEERRLKQ